MADKNLGGPEHHQPNLPIADNHDSNIEHGQSKPATNGSAAQASFPADTDAIAVGFLRKLRPGGPWVLTAITPDGPTTTQTFTDETSVRAFIGRHDGKRNIYYSVNPTRNAMVSKASKVDIAAIEYLLADLDPEEGESSDHAKGRYLAAIEAHGISATAVVDSGNGIQTLYKLSDRIVLPEPVVSADGNKVLSPEAAALVGDVEARARALMIDLGSVAGTQNVDRVLRLPGTTNLPNAKKIRDGRTPCPTSLIDFGTATHRLEDFPQAATAPQEDTPSTGGIDWDAVSPHAGWLRNATDLPADFSPKGKTIVGHVGNVKDLNLDLKRAGLIEKNYPSWSEVSLALAAIFKADGRFTPEQIAAALMCEIDCNQHVTKLGTEASRRRAVERLFYRSFEPPAQVARLLDWRECLANGLPKSSMYNARLMIAALSIDCSYDTFHDKVLFGYRDDEWRHEVNSIAGEVSDDGVLALRQLMSNKFGFDPTDQHVRDAVRSLALEKCFNPVFDMLAEAQTNWDGVERLDRFAVDYVNCKDTPLNRAFGRITMIAAVRRVRKPGCKHDAIFTIEGPEGWNKSTLWRVLAGDENFSDERIIGKDSREVQEQLAKVWIHENAELAGMKKADIDVVKSFASRTTDRARPAYGHFLKEQQRHSIEVGTTNDTQYLQSNNGNRRFWTAEIQKPIDIDLVARDRLQLWGEAATRESMGESIVLDTNLWAAAAAAQEERRVDDAWEDVIEEIMDAGVVTSRGITNATFGGAIIHEERDADGSPEWRVSTAALWARLGIGADRQNSNMAKRLATVMRLAGWKRTKTKITINGTQVRGYFRKPGP